MFKKRLVLGCFRSKEEQDKDNETGLKEGGGIEIEKSTSIRAPFSLYLPGCILIVGFSLIQVIFLYNVSRLCTDFWYTSILNP